MTQSAKDLENTFERAIDLLVHNWVLVVPGFVVALLGTTLTVLFNLALGGFALSGNGTPEAAAFISGVGSIGTFLIASSAAMVQMAFVTGMAGKAWRSGHATLRDGWNALQLRWAPLIPALALLFLLGFCAAVLAAATLFVTLIIYAVVFIYTIAAVVIGERPVVAGLVESAKLAAGNPLPTIAVVAIIGLISLAGGWLGNLVGHYWAFGGWLTAEILQQVTVACACLVIVGEYLKLTSTEVGS